MYGTAKALTFVSQCVDVVKLEAPAHEEVYRIRCRPCRDECYRHKSCPDWDRAMASIGDWVADAEPVAVVELGDDEDVVEEFTLQRLVLRVDTPWVEPHNHWVWECGDISDGLTKAVDYINQGLDFGEKVVVMAGPLCIDMLQQYLPESLDVFYFNAELLLLLAQDEEFDERAFRRIPGTQVVQDLVERGHTVRVYTGHLPLLLGKGEIGAALQVERYLNRLIDDLGVMCACAIPSATPNLDTTYRQLCQEHVRMTVV